MVQPVVPAADTPTENDVQRTRAWTGLLVVLLGDVAVATSAIWGIVEVGDTANGQLVAILTSGFTAITAMTTAYFGIRAATNAAQAAVNKLGTLPPGASASQG
jgi:hypothetical protein